MDHFYVRKDELLEKQNLLIQKLHLYGFTGSTEIRNIGEHIFGRSYSSDRYNDARFYPERLDPIVRIWNNGMNFHTFLHFRSIFDDYMTTYTNEFDCIKAIKHSLPIPA